MFENQNEIVDLSISPISIIEELAKNITDESDVKCNFYQSAEDVPDPREISSVKKNQMVFEICYLNKKHMWIILSQRKTQQRQLFLFSSKLFQAQRSSIRENANFICLFPQDMKNLNHIFEDHVGSDMTKEEFRKLCKTAPC